MIKNNAGLLVFLLLLTVLPLRAQTLATLEGTTFDSTRAVLPDTLIEAIGPTVSRTVLSDDKGFYRLMSLPAGDYTITATRSGFTRQVLQNVVLVLDRVVTLDITMTVEAREESIAVTAILLLIDRTDSSIRQVTDTRTIEAIPLNGRNYLDLIQLSPGVIVNTEARSDLANGDTKGAILGDRAGNAGFLVNGLENNDDFHGGVFQSYTQDAIQEFEVIETGYKPEFGRASGGIVNVLTKSGTNTLHGSAFLFARNDALDASNVPKQPPPPLRRYDSGLTAGGPLRRDKSWLFGSLENFQEKRSAIFPSDIPDLLRANEDFSRQPENHNVLTFTKYTQRLNNKNDLRAEAGFTHASLLNELAYATSLPSNSRNSLTRTALGTLALTTMFTPRLTLDSAFSFRGQNAEQNRNSAAGGASSVFFLDDGASFDFGPPAGSVQSLHQRYYTARESLSAIAGPHAAKFGFEFLRTQANGANGHALVNIILTTHPLFALFGKDSFQIPQGVAFLNPGDNLSRLTNNGAGFFAQDDWKIHPKVLLSLGGRYDYDSKFGNNNVSPRLGVTFRAGQQTLLRASWGLFYDRYRLGVLQAVPEFGGFNGQNALEYDFPRLAADALFPLPRSIAALAQAAGDPNFLNKQFGIPAGALVTASNVRSLTGRTPAQFAADVNTYLATLNQPFIPVDFSPSTGYLRQNLTVSPQDQIRAAQAFHTPYNTSLVVGVERQIGGDLIASVDYIHRNIRNILGVIIPNLAFESRMEGSPITTNGGPLQRTYGPWYSGRYDAAVFSLQKRFARRFQIQANYTHSKSIDNLLNANLGLGIGAQGGGALPTDNLNLNFDRGNSDLSIPDVVVTSGIVNLPASFWVSGVLRATKGVHFTAAGTPTDYDGDRIFSVRPPGTSRNQFLGPATANLDMRVEKRFALGERFMASALVEFFNLFNARNPALIDNAWINGAPGPQFGKVRVPLPGREIQIGVRFQK